MTRPTNFPHPPLRRVPAAVGVDEILTIFHEDGAVVIENFIDLGVIEQLNHDLEPYLADDMGIMKRLADFHGTGSKRICNLPAKSKTFRENLLNDTLVHDICRRIYYEQQHVDYWLTMGAMLQNAPGPDKQALHRDQILYPLANTLGPQSPMVMLNFFVALGDVTAENGGTRVIPGSHLWPDYSDNGENAVTVPVTMQAGDVFLLGGKTVHGAGQNITQDSIRRLIIFGFQPGYLTPFESFMGIPPDIVESMTPLARRMVGWASPKVGGMPIWTIDTKDVARWREQEVKMLAQAP